MITRRNILWLTVARMVVSTLLLGTAAAVESAPEGWVGLSPAVLALAATYLLSGIYAFLLWLDRHYVLQLRLQIGCDLSLVTILIFLSGEMVSTYASLYLLIIAYAALLSGKAVGYASAAFATILYVGMMDLAYFGIVHFPPTDLTFEIINFRMAVVVLGFVTVSYLSATLSERLKKVRLELEEKTGYLADLRVFNENILDSLRSGLITTDLDGNIRTANRAAEFLTDTPGYRLIGRPLATVLPADFVSWFLTADLEPREEPLRREFWLSPSTGHRKYFGFSLSPLMNKKEELVGHIVSFQDLTEIERLREEVAIKDRMAAVGNMAAAIAHEIRNPLASMHGSIQVLRKEVMLQGDDVRLMDIVLRESNRLNKIIEDFLSYARPREIERVAVDLNQIIDETLALLRNHPVFQKDRHMLHHSDGQRLQMLGDPDMLRQVCWNLATNSLKAMPAGGELRIDGTRSDARTVRLRFMDQGVGMDVKEKSLLFQPFHSAFSDGMGIGMAIVYQIVNQHGGRITVESQKGAGTTVELEFARAAAS